MLATCRAKPRTTVNRMADEISLLGGDVAHAKASFVVMVVPLHALELIDQNPLNPSTPNRPPGNRVHDLRHAMACNRMLSGYRQGINPQAQLTHLSTFMGHTDIRYTLTYLNVTPELAQIASERFRQHAGHLDANL
jgi:hypothetical protein